MTKDLSIKWKADREDPNIMTMYDIEFPANIAVPVPADHPMIEKFKGNKWFEVSGGDEPAETGPYSVQRKGNGKGRPSTYVIVGDNVPAHDDEYQDEESARTMCEMLNSEVGA